MLHAQTIAKTRAKPGDPILNIEDKTDAIRIIWSSSYNSSSGKRQILLFFFLCFAQPSVVAFGREFLNELGALLIHSDSA